MDQKSGKSDHFNDKSDENPHKKTIFRRNKFKWAWEFWSEHPVPILLLFFGGIFVTPMFDFMGEKVKVWSVGFGIWLMLGAGIAFVCKSIISARAPTTQPAFFVTKTWQTGGPSSGYRFVDEYRPGLRRVTEADCAFLIEFTNCLPSPIMIAGYVVGEKLPNGEWKTAERMQLGSIGKGKIFAGNDLKHAKELIFQTFDDAIQNKSIAPHETVRGWIVFKRWPEGDFRLEVRDMKGTIMTEPFSPAFTKDFETSSATPWPSQPMLMSSADNTEDISDLPTW